MSPTFSGATKPAPRSRARRARRTRTLAACAVLVLGAFSVGAYSTCPPAGWTRDALVALKAAQWRVDDDAPRATLAIGLVDCLADPDPLLRDGVAFEALSAWLRAKQLPETTLRALHDALKRRLDAPDDAQGFARPFAALALSEVARADRVQPFLTSGERTALVDSATRYLRTVRDYRGFEPAAGWRHGVAHGADLLLQLAVNPHTTADDHRKMLDAIAAQIAPADGHSYVFGESERLARPVLFIARRGTLDATDWSRWMKFVTGPGAFPDWEGALRSPAGLSRRHNVGGFVFALYANLREGSDDASRQALLPATVEALRALP